MKRTLTIFSLIFSLALASCSKDADLDAIDIRDDLVGRWNTTDNSPVGKNNNERVVTFYKVENSKTEIRVQNLVKTHLFFNVSYSDTGSVILTPTSANIMPIELNVDNSIISLKDKEMKLDYTFEGAKIKSLLYKY